MSDLTPIIQAHEDGMEVLPPTRAPQVSMELVAPPDIRGLLGEFRDRLHDALAIPPEAYLPGREVVIEVQMAPVPTSVKATIRNSSNS